MGGSRRSTAGMPMRPLLCHVTKCSSHHDGACGTGSAELHGLLHAGWHLRSGDRNEGELREIAFGAPVSRRPIPKPCTTEATATERSNAPPSYISSAAHPMMRPSTRATNAVSRWSSRPSTGSSASRSSCRIDGPSSAVALSMSTFIRVISGCEYVPYEQHVGPQHPFASGFRARMNALATRPSICDAISSTFRPVSARNARASSS
jgi:hypothetical protein